MRVKKDISAKIEFSELCKRHICLKSPISRDVNLYFFIDRTPSSFPCVSQMTSNLLCYSTFGSFCARGSSAECAFDYMAVGKVWLGLWASTHGSSSALQAKVQIEQDANVTQLYQQELIMYRQASGREPMWRVSTCTWLWVQVQNLFMRYSQCAFNYALWPVRF